MLELDKSTIPTTVGEAGRFLADQVLTAMNVYSLPTAREKEAIEVMANISNLSPDEAVCQVAHRLLFPSLHTRSPSTVAE